MKILFAIFFGFLCSCSPVTPVGEHNLSNYFVNLDDGTLLYTHREVYNEKIFLFEIILDEGLFDGFTVAKKEGKFEVSINHTYVASVNFGETLIIKLSENGKIIIITQEGD